METAFDILNTTRAFVLKKIEGFSNDQLNKIPKGFKNNIAWNVAHLVVTQQLLHYKLSGLQCLISDEMITTYKKGSFPSEEITKEEFEEIKQLFIGLPQTLEEDFKANIFKQYIEYPTSLGFKLDSIKRAIEFNNLHEGLHLGTIMALIKLV